MFLYGIILGLLAAGAWFGDFGPIVAAIFIVVFVAIFICTLAYFWEPEGGDVMTKNWEPSEELYNKICLRISEGESLRSICRDGDMPNRQTVLNWQDSSPSFSARCARARLEQADWIHDDMADIEDKTLRGTIEPTAARVVLSSKQWRAAKLAPKKYGDKITQENVGADGGPMQVETTKTVIFLPRNGRE